MVKFEKEYNYFKDVNPDYEKPKFCFENRVDPDSASAKLYHSLWKCFFYDQNINKKYGIKQVEMRGQRNGYNKDAYYYTLFINGNKFLLSADYIGPSTYWCKNEHIKEIDIVNESRVLGGHMVWPRGFNETINNQRGTEEGLYDRIDCTLKLLEVYYKLINYIDKEPAEEFFIETCKRLLYENKENVLKDEERIKRMCKAFNNSYEWLKLFKEFKNFCDFFILKNSFVDENYDVISFYGELFPVQQPTDKYRVNNIDAVKARNDYIFQE